jgi:hypothetical protein
MLRLVKNTIKQIVLISFFIFISSSNSFASNTTPIEFSITSSTAGYDAYGIGCEISTVRSTPTPPTITIPEIVANTQHVYVSSSTKSDDGTQEVVTVSYNADSNVTGLHLKVHYDSSAVTLSEITNVLQTNIFITPFVANVEADTNNEDGNADTDMLMAWASFTGWNWPGSTPANLLTMTFDIAEGATGSSAISFSSSGTAPGYTFEGQTHELNFDSQTPNYSDNCDSPANLNNEQAVYIANSTTISSQKQVTIGYASSDPNLTILGFKIHYDSSALTLSEITDVLQTNLFIAPFVANVQADVDNEDGNANTDMFINMSWASFTGSSWPGSTPANLLTMTFDIIENDTPIQPMQPKQLISVANTPRGIMGKTSVLEVAYDTTDNNNQLSGLGMRVHFDSSLLSFKGTTDIIEQDIIVNGEGPFNDSADLDNDPLTDQYMSFGWASLFNNWPDTNLPTILMNMAFDVSNSFGIDSISSTNINFTDSAFTSGYEFSAETYSMEILKATWDFDENGQADALSDGLMMIRYLFGLRGSIITNSTVSSDSSLSSEEIVANIEAAMDIADIDADDKHNALTDGLLLMRYLFGLRDNSLINNVVSLEAARFASEEVEEYIERFMPDDEMPISILDEVGPLAFVNTFGGAQIPADSEFLMPTEGSDGGGFSIDKSESGENTDANPLYFGTGGYISFVGSVPDGGDVDVKFDVQFDAYPNTTPNYMTDVVTVSGAAEKNYSVSIPEQFDNGYKNVIVWLETYDTTVVMKEIMVGVTAQGAAKVGATESALFTGPFEGAEYDAETNTYTFPASAKSYAGFSNDNANLYPMTFDVGGCVTFNASAETAVSIRYKFERQPYPANTPEMFTEYVTISGTVQEYTLDVPPSATAGNTYSSFLLFIDADDRNLPVVITDVVATNTGACGI